MRCARCGRACREDAKYCDGCGGPLAKGTGGDRDHTGSSARFVGREREFAVVDGLLSSTVSGSGAIAALTGDPGIGKTRTAEMIAERAISRGLCVLWARCSEEPGAPPYWLWQQLVTAWDQLHNDATFGGTLSSLATALPEFAPELLERRVNALGDRSPSIPTPEGAQERFRLFDAISKFWQRAAKERALMLVIDNIHWADASSLRLLEFLVPDFTGCRVLVLLTYRDMELSRQHPLSATLAELSRDAHFARLRLTGLSYTETARLTEIVAGMTFSPELINAIYTRAEGNPLFVGEMTRVLAQETHTHDRASPLRVPEGIREVIGRRLNRLSLTANKVLAAASVIGRAFDLRLLAPLLDGLDENACSEAIEEALQAHVLEASREPGRYYFAHALFRETLYEEIPAPRRGRLHLGLARTIEAVHGDDLDSYLPLLAHHQWSALPGGEVSKAVDYAQRAARRADRQLAHEDAARYYQRALQAMDCGGGFSREARCGMVNALGTALNRAGEYLQALEVFKEAARLAAECGSAQELAKAALGFEMSSWCPGLPGGTAAALLREALTIQDDSNPVVVSHLLSALARAMIFSGEEKQATLLHEQAVAAARRAADPAALADALIATLSLRWQHERISERIVAADEAFELAKKAGDRLLMYSARAWRMFDAFEIGDLAGWRNYIDDYEREAEGFRQPFLRYVAASSRTMHALFEGRFEDAERLAQATFEIGRRMPGLDAAGVFGVQMFTLRRDQGRLQEVAPLVAQFVKGTAQRGVWQPGLAVMYVELGQPDSAREEFEALARDEFRGIARDGVWVASLVYLTVVCHSLADAKRAEMLYALLAPLSGRNLLAGTTIASFGAADGILGMLSATLGRWDEAERHFDAALTMNEGQGARPALARTRLHYAQMLFRRGRPEDRERAHSLLAAAESDSVKFGMQLLRAGVENERKMYLRVIDSVHQPAGLSKREAQVLRLIALGKGNRQIAKELYVSPNTVANHVRNVLSKTRSSNRTEAAAFAVRNELV